MSKIFTLEESLASESVFKIGIEFKKSDEEIKKILEKTKSPISLLNSLFFGYSLLKVNGQYPFGNHDKEGKGRYAIDSHPLVYLDFIVTTLKSRLQPEPNFSDYLTDAEKYFFNTPIKTDKARKFHKEYQIARNTGVGLNLAIMSPDNSTTSIIWYDPEKDQIMHESIPKELFKKEVTQLKEKVVEFLDKMPNIERTNAYKRLTKV